MYFYTTYILFSENDRRFTDKVQKKKPQNFFAKFFSNFFFPHQKRMEESNSTVTDHSLPSFSARNIQVHKRFHIFQLCTFTLHTFYFLNMIDASPTKFKNKKSQNVFAKFFSNFFFPHQKRMEESNSTVTDHSLPSFSARNIRVHKRFHIFQLCTSTLHTFYFLKMIDALPTKFKKKNHKIFLQSFFQIFFSPIRSV
jgi:hypothetical protein